MVKDIRSGSGGSSLSYLTAIGNTLYFKAYDGTHGYELWMSDGTSSGTVMVKDIYSGSSDSNPNYLTAVGNTLYFKATDGTQGYELWSAELRSDGSGVIAHHEITYS
jgi:ELWxxDGT repeat protein